MTTTLAPHITRSIGYGGTTDADCTLCDAHASSHGMWAQQDTDAWVQEHATECTPTTIRQNARHLREAESLIAQLAVNGDPALWDEGNGSLVAATIIEHFRAEANRLEDNAAKALATSSGSAGPRADGGVR